ncbi:hypothetical protein B0H13DRAFT_2083467 [Mycena leptocephala]|nr:hypothetical protein B0H13DRAFT_2083467 [Mycena leptocephala]
MVLFIAVAAVPLLALLVGGSPSPFMDASLRRRDANDTVEPQFPASPASCGVCSQIKLCINVVPAAANSTTIIDNPGEFFDLLTCGCSSTFNTTFRAFENTNQQAVLNMSDPDAVVTGLEKVCAFERALGINKNALGAMTLMLVNAWWY